MPKPAAAFSALTTTNSSPRRRRRPGRCSASPSRPDRPTTSPKKARRMRKNFPLSSQYSALAVDGHTLVADPQAWPGLCAPQALHFTAEFAEEAQRSQRCCALLRVLCAFSAPSAVILGSACGALTPSESSLGPGFRRDDG